MGLVSRRGDVYGAGSFTPAPVTLRLTNTLTRTRETFVPLVDRQVGIYCCGVTVYDLCHLGHARSYIVWDVLRRHLIWSGYAVTFVQNFTDIDDKILARAAAEGSSMEAVSERNISAFEADMAALNILPPDRMPRATRSLDSIRALISTLERSGAAYSADGDVYFAVTRARNYGRLSGRDLDQQQDGASGRLAAVEEARKRHPFDFALWKGAKPGEPSFPSPWGPGRPGWHIECSAMVRDELGETIDIHLGGADLIFPHHENEIAQSETASGKPLARYWLHNGMVNVGGEKMSKSLGNFITIRDLLNDGTSPMTLRLFVLQAHYRKPLDFSRESLAAAESGWKGLNAALGLAGSHPDLAGPAWQVGDDGAPATLEAVRAELASDSDLLARLERFQTAMDDDLNTAAALGELFDLARPLRALANRLRCSEPPSQDDRQLAARWRLLVVLAAVLGLRREAGADAAASAAERLEDSAIAALVEQRRLAKANRDFASADRLRDELKAAGIELIDKAGGVTVWLRQD